MIHIQFNLHPAVIIPAVLIIIASVIWLIRHLHFRFFPRRIRIVSGLLRMVSVILFLLILTGFSLTFEGSRFRRPLTVFAWDNSKSMIYSDTEQAIPSDILNSELYRRISRGSRIKHITGNALPRRISARQARKLDFLNRESDIGAMLLHSAEEMEAKTVILVSDGMSYSGPVLSTLKLGPETSCFAIASGDTSGMMFPFVEKISVPENSSHGESVRISVSLRNRSLNAMETTLKLMIDSSESLRHVKIAPGFHHEITMTRDSLLAGQHVVQIFSDGDGEAVLLGEKSFFVNNGRTSVCYFANPPNPDIRTVVNILQTAGYDCFSYATWIKTYPDSLPDLTVELIKDSPPHFPDGPGFFFYMGGPGQQAGSAVPIRRTVETLFLENLQENITAWKKCPPITVYPDHIKGRVLVQSRNGLGFIGRTEKACHIAASGLWRWRTTGYRRVYDGLYKHFILRTAENLLQGREGRIIEFEADNISTTAGLPTRLPISLSDKAVMSDELMLSLRDSRGAVIHRQRGSVSGGTDYSWTPPDSGVYRAIVRLMRHNSLLVADSLSLVVSETDLEALFTGCDFGTLRDMVRQNGGRILTPQELETGDPGISFEKTWTDVHSSFSAAGSPLIYILLLILLTGDWIIRKRNGTI